MSPRKAASYHDAAFLLAAASHSLGMTAEQLQDLIDDASYDHAMGDSAAAVIKLTSAVAAVPTSFEGWHALAEIHFSERSLDAALAAAEHAHALRPDDLFINTTLSRVWMEKGDKPMAEKFGAQAKILAWKDQLKNPAAHQGGLK